MQIKWHALTTRLGKTKLTNTETRSHTLRDCSVAPVNATGARIVGGRLA